MLYLLGFSGCSYCILSQTREILVPHRWGRAVFWLQNKVGGGDWEPQGCVGHSPAPSQRHWTVCSWLPARPLRSPHLPQEGDFLSCAHLSPGSCSEVWSRGVKRLDRAWTEWSCFSGATEPGWRVRNMNGVTPWGPFFGCASPKRVCCTCEEAGTRQGRTPVRSLPCDLAAGRMRRGSVPFCWNVQLCCFMRRGTSRDSWYTLPVALVGPVFHHFGKW